MKRTVSFPDFKRLPNVLLQRMWMVTLLTLLAFTGGCSSSDEVQPGPPIERDLAAIQARDTLVALTTYNSTSYFLYRGAPMGYEYDLLKAFADAQDLALKMVVVRNRDSLYHRLNQGDGDLVAARIIPTASDSADVAFTRALYETRPVVVQQQGAFDSLDAPQMADSLLAKEAPRDLKPIPDSTAAPQPDSVVLRARLVSKPSDLTGQAVYLPGSSAYEEHLVELSDSLTGDIEVVELSGTVSTEALIRRVAEGKIKLTISPSNLAKLKESYYTNIVVRPQVGEPDRVAWAVRRNAPELLEALNTWISAEENQDLFDDLYQTYFVDRRGYLERQNDEYLTSETGRLSAYDDLLQQYADSVGWDWRLLASQTYQESRFDPKARSWAGAAGLLQLMPPTAREFDVHNVYNPEANVAGATRFLNWLKDYWKDKIKEVNERRRFILASYNTGHGHVEDARRLARKNGDNPNKWKDVAYWLLQKSKRKFYTDPVVKYGFCRGLEPVTYVSRILDRFNHYKQFVVQEGPATAEASDEPPMRETAAE